MTRLLSTWRGWLFAIFAAVMLTACDPIVDIVAPPEAEVGVPVAFATERLPQFKDAEFTDLQYEWDFGDGGRATGPTALHTYAQPGEYEVVLSVSDVSTRNWGQAYISKKTIRVTTYTGALVPVSVRVYDDNGRTVQGATVTLGAQSAQTDLAGGVLIAPAAPMAQPVVVIRKSGYLTQSVIVPDGQPAERGVVVTLKKEAPALALNDIAAAQTVAPPEANLNPRVTLPVAAFVNAQGEPVQGVASVRVTPWDITSQADMAAFPGDSKADDGTGRIVSLISFGMLSIEFEQGGQKLQLAPGKTAVISMDLPITQDIQGRDIHVGDTIPLWHFNETRGVWEREGDGVVVASETSSTGLGVRAEVSHFSAWNWDKITEPDVSPVARAITCRIPDGAGGLKALDPNDLCLVRIEQLRPNGQVLTSSVAIAGAGDMTYSMFVSDAHVILKAEALVDGSRGRLDWVVSGASENAPLVVPLNERLLVETDTGELAVVTESPSTVDFYVPNGWGYRVVDTENVKVYSKSPIDGSLTELPFPVYATQEDTNGVPKLRQDAELYRLTLHGGGNAPGQDAVGRLSGVVVAKLPVYRDYAVGADGSYVPSRTEYLEAEITIASRTYSGPTLVRSQSHGLTFALWDEVGVSTPIRPESIVDVRLVVADGGWLSGESSVWHRVRAPFGRFDPDPNEYGSMVSGPYFTRIITCGDLGESFLGFHQLKMFIRVTDPKSMQAKIYQSQIFTADAPAPACT